MNFSRLVKEWAWRVNDGMPDPLNRTHVEFLRDVLRESGYAEDFIMSYTQNLTEDKTPPPLDDKEKEKAKKLGLVWKGKGYGKKEDNFISYKNVDGKLVAAEKDDSKPEDKEKEVDNTKLSAKDGDFERKARKASEDKKTSGFEDIAAYQEKTSSKRDKGIAGMGGAAASQGESRFGNALDTLNEEEFRAQNNNAIQAEKENIASKGLSVKQREDCKMNGLEPGTEKGNQFLAEREVWSQQELKRVKDDKDSVFYKKGKAGFSGKDEDYLEWMRAAYDGARATKKVLTEDTALDTNKTYKTIQSEGKIDDIVESEIKKKLDEAEDKDKDFYEKQLKSFDKNKAYHDTYVVGEDENGRMIVISISNKKSSELTDPQANTTPANRFKQIAEQFGKDVSKRVTDSLESSIEDVSDAKMAGMKKGNQIAFDDEIAKVCDLPIMETYMDKLNNHAKFNEYLESNNTKISDLSTKEKLEKMQEYSKKLMEDGKKPAYVPFGKIYTKIGEFTRTKKFEKKYPDIDVQSSEAIANCIDIKAQEKAVVEQSYKTVLSDIEKADEEAGHSGKENGPHKQGYIATVMKAMHFDSYIEQEDGSMLIAMGGRVCQPSQIRGCLSKLSGFSGDTNTPEGRKKLNEHILKTSKVDAETGALTINSPDGKVELATDVWRTAGTSQKVASAIGKGMRTCLKENIDERRNS